MVLRVFRIIEYGSKYFNSNLTSTIPYDFTLEEQIKADTYKWGKYSLSFV